MRPDYWGGNLTQFSHICRKY